jgi:hypothetical protein
MASKDEQKKTGLPTGAIVAIVIIIIALLGAIGWFLYSSRTNVRANVGTPAPVGNAGVTSMPSANNVSAGAPTVNAGGVARTGAQV